MATSNLDAFEGIHSTTSIPPIRTVWGSLSLVLIGYLWLYNGFIFFLPLPPWLTGIGRTPNFICSWLIQPLCHLGLFLYLYWAIIVWSLFSTRMLSLGPLDDTLSSDSSLTGWRPPEIGNSCVSLAPADVFFRGWIEPCFFSSIEIWSNLAKPSICSYCPSVKVSVLQTWYETTHNSGSMVGLSSFIDESVNPNISASFGARYKSGKCACMIDKSSCLFKRSLESFSASFRLLRPRPRPVTFG